MVFKNYFEIVLQINKMRTYRKSHKTHQYTFFNIVGKFVGKFVGKLSAKYVKGCVSVRFSFDGF
jgi:hypothetical protein